MSFTETIGALARAELPLKVSEAPFGHDIHALTEVATKRQSPTVFIARSEEQARKAMRLARFFAPKLPRLMIPGWDNLPYDRVSPSSGVAAARVAALCRLSKGLSKPALIIIPAASFIQRTAPKAVLSKASLILQTGKSYAQEQIEAFLAVNGYIRSSTVREAGEFAIRGGIIDIFAPTLSEPIRLDFFGDELEGLRSFDAETQVSSTSLSAIELTPVSEILFLEDTPSRFRNNYLEKLGSPSGDKDYEAAYAGIKRQGIEQWLPLFYDGTNNVSDFLPADSLIALDPHAIAAMKARLEQIEDHFQARKEAAINDEHRALAPGALYWSEAEIDALPKNGPRALFSSFDTGENTPLSLGGKAGFDFAPLRLAEKGNVYEAAAEYVKNLSNNNKTPVFCGLTKGSAERLINILGDHGVEGIRRANSYEKATASTTPAISVLPIDSGFETDTHAFITEADMLGERTIRQKPKRKAANFIQEASALETRDLVVHTEHGVGRYLGLKTLTVQRASHDCLELEYAGGDKLFLPVENIELISRYGQSDGTAALDKLGGVNWQARKAKAKRRIMDMAEELIALAAKRLTKPANVFTPIEGEYERFSARFPYVETDDQLRSIEDVTSDLSLGRPMDRLICGDVGFGKTEVAMRAAFLVALGGAQVAIIAPTTLLARQHFETFKARFAGLPVKIGQLSRLVSAKDAEETREAIKNGTCDIVIGTHALLAKSIEFDRLGLLIIDEEQRFGVKHKERLKDLKEDVHVLTLSATPIPRTLQMSLTGIRDLSLIATPPVDRLAVRTYVTELDATTMREALLREKYRGGQSFVVAPRIKDLPTLEDMLHEHVPEVNFVVAHGQMPAKELEDKMTAFYEGKHDVLLSTTIVESGLDVPRANTLIIHRADMFGLAQLYQLRGRVGRSKTRAYAYMTTGRSGLLNPMAEKRLKVLQSLDSLGAGFTLASHDLDMRGGGNLLGEDQSGHIKEVGVELYQAMLRDAVEEIKHGGSPLEETWSPQLNLGVSALLPEDYVEDLGVRLSLYRRLADLKTQEERDSFAAELTDRFGDLPEEAKGLLQVSEIKALCKTIGIEKLDAGDKGIVLSFRENASIDPSKLVEFVRSDPRGLKLRPDMKLVAFGDWPDTARRSKAASNILKKLSELLVG